ncbi:hypothetical protein [Glycomyces algeriensis]|uniref:Uncharacterized protein n=1 Tax=Glycomyces algeriensis TaxID=256037 RepID=A0A9W6LHT8_9ACTN|nr:hypothetical protein [Glycomyces algeriensis]MDA1364268.1 hypothetical protein [Glycomyces algeriensis]MDR7350298.1 hypothetical protein [Glycomyces algeriensis]GLI43006.1 hypothetical protein GALLR39Z86_28560 [Glycomyces algeriensis]
MSLSVVFLLGMVGALAPEIVRLYAIRSAPERFRWSWFYLAVSLAFAGVGGVLAMALPATTYWGALYVGVSTPVLVNTMVRKGRERTSPPTATRSAAQYSLIDSYLYALLATAGPTSLEAVRGLTR